MATKKPRIQVTLNKDLYDTISRMAELSKVSRSSVVSGLLETIHPPLTRTVAVLEAASEAPQHVQKQMYEVALYLENEMNDVADASTEHLDALFERVVEPAKKGRGNPRTSNTGVRSDKPLKNKKKKKRLKNGKPTNNG